MRFAREVTGMVGLGIGGVLLASCGIDDTETLSKPEFIEQADAICEATDAELEPVWDQLWEMDEAGVEPSEEMIFVRFAQAMQTIGPAWDESVDDIRALEPPSEDQETIDELLIDLEAAIDDVEATVTAAAAGDEEARRIMDSESVDPMADVNQRARDYGLAVCGSEE